MSEMIKGPARRGKRILVVDDDTAVREMLVRVLTGDGYGVSAAADGGEAIAQAAIAPPDLVLLDLGREAAGGWETFEQLTRGHPGLAVVIVTANANENAAAKAAGAAAFFEKPPSFPELLRVVSRLVGEAQELQKHP